MGGRRPPEAVESFPPIIMLWWKTIHIIAIISWMAGLLYLFRLFVYHNQEREATVRERFQMMEKKLFLIIATPAMALALISGLAMVGLNASFYMKAGWFHAKLAAVFLLLLLHFWSIPLSKKLRSVPNPYNNIRLRLLNELPTLLMILIVILVVIKPF